MKNKRTALLGLGIDSVTEEEAVPRIFQELDIAKTQQTDCRIVVTVNVDFIVNTLSVFASKAKNPELLRVMQESFFVFADGMPIVLLSKLVGHALKERVAGSNLFEKMIAQAAKSGKRVFFLGGNPENTIATSQILLKKYPDLQIAGMDTSMIKMDDSQECLAQHKKICQKIQDDHTDLLLVGLGNPKQELFAYRNQKALAGIVSIGIGGTFNFIAGGVKRAPRWMQKGCMEWIYRIIQEPRRLIGRYSKGLVIYSLLSLQTMLSCLFALLKNSKTKEFSSMPLLKEEASAVSLDLTGIRYFDNAAKLKWLAIINNAATKQQKIQLKNCSPFLRMQLKLARFWADDIKKRI